MSHLIKVTVSANLDTDETNDVLINLDTVQSIRLVSRLAFNPQRKVKELIVGFADEVYHVKHESYAIALFDKLTKLKTMADLSASALQRESTNE